MGKPLYLLWLYIIELYASIIPGESYEPLTIPATIPAPALQLVSTRANLEAGNKMQNDCLLLDRTKCWANLKFLSPGLNVQPLLRKTELSIEVIAIITMLVHWFTNTIEIYSHIWVIWLWDKAEKFESFLRHIARIRYAKWVRLPGHKIFLTRA